MNFYHSLGLNKGATEDEIKKAYRELAKTKHPDKGGTEEDFKSISLAYEVLSNREKRAKYDRGEPFESEDRDTRARRNLCKIFNTITDDGYFDHTRSDLFKRIRGEVNEIVLKMESDLEDAEIRIGKLEEIKSRIRGADFLIESVDNSISMLNMRVTGIEEEIEVSRVMKDMIKEGIYEQDPEIDEEEEEYDEYPDELERLRNY